MYLLKKLLIYVILGPQDQGYSEPAAKILDSAKLQQWQCGSQGDFSSDVLDLENTNIGQQYPYLVEIYRVVELKLCSGWIP